MIEIQQVKLLVDEDDQATRIKKAAHILGISSDEITEIVILRRSVDARKKENVFLIYRLAVSIKNEEAFFQKKKNAAKFFPYQKEEYTLPKTTGLSKKQPVIIGAGPAGLFCAYILALAGLQPVVIERGKKVEKRKEDVLRFWETGEIDADSNVSFGEGGAGTFSDGKLNTLVKDRSGRNRFVLETFVRFGAPEEILYDYKPHIGTDRLTFVITEMRKAIEDLGGSFYFESKVSDLIIKDQKINGILLHDGRTMECDRLVLAIGHSARDTFRMLWEKELFLTAKEFAVGFRVEHPRVFIDECQFGTARSHLGAAPYKLAAKTESGRGVYSFCMCPGGYVINASSGEGQCVVNGMSYHGRDGENSNSAIVVSVGKEEFDLSKPLAGMEYQKALEKKAFSLGNGRIPQQLLGDFKQKKKSLSYGRYVSQNKGGAVLCDLNFLMSDSLRSAFLDGMEIFDRKMKGFGAEDVILSGMESRTSSPVRIVRDENFVSNIKGIYPCGEGAGYAGGIISAAMDGIKVAEALIASLKDE